MVAGKGPRMLQLTARHADLWNTAWHASPAAASERIESVRAACAAEGRDPSTLEVTVGIPLLYPDLGSAAMANSLSVTSAEQVAETLADFAAHGVGHAIIDLAPHTPEALDRFAEAVRIYRNGSR